MDASGGVSCSLLVVSWSQNNCVKSHLCSGWCSLPPSPAKGESGKARGGWEAPSTGDGAFPSAPPRRQGCACRQSLKHGLADSSVLPAQEQTRLPLEAWPTAFLQTVGRRGKTTPFFLALPIWRGLTPPKHCSALERSHTQLCLTFPNLTVVLWIPAEFPPSWSSWTLALAKNPAQASQN